MNILLDVIKDTIFILPLLFVIYIILEYIESKEINYSKYLKKYGPFFGALFGVIPECSFSVISSVLFVEGHITLGTLISVFIATSDEAIPLLLLNPKQYNSVLLLMVFKIVVGIIVGYLVDTICLYKMPLVSINESKLHNSSIVVDAFMRTLKVYGFVFVMNLMISLFIHFIGMEHLRHLLMRHKILQPVVCTMIGFIPNCSISILLVELYSNSMIFFGSLFAGLSVNGGLGLFVLIQRKLNIRVLFIIISILFVTGLTSALILNTFI